MNISEIHSTIDKLIPAIDKLNFDHFKFHIQDHDLLGIRVANSIVCRENVFSKQINIMFEGSKNRKKANFSTGVLDPDYLLNQVKELAQTLESQSADEEYVDPQPPEGTFTWIISKNSLLENFSPERIYAILEKKLAKVRSKNLRVTGYIEGEGQRIDAIDSNAFSLSSQDNGLSFTFTVDNPENGATGVGKGAILSCDAIHLENEIEAALEKATEICELNNANDEIEAGDYTVILSPSATYDIILTTLIYGFFDRRKIDEGRTYLSNKLQEFSFPEDIKLSINKVLKNEHHNYACVPFNNRLRMCDDLNLIDQGKIKDSMISAYWAEKNNLAETFNIGDGCIQLQQVGSTTKTAKNLDELIKSTKKGIFVNDTWYLRMVSEMDGIITGMTRDGVFKIEDGKITTPIRNMRWHDNPFRILQSISGITSDRQLIGRSKVAGFKREPLAYIPAIKVEDFHFSSVTKF